MLPPPPTTTLFPYTTLFRSGRNHAAAISRHPGMRVAALVDTVPEASAALAAEFPDDPPGCYATLADALDGRADRKSTRLNSSHMSISYAVFCLKKKIEGNIS